MKANELRIGNLVYWDIPQKKNVVHIISAILPNTLHTQPISLGKHKDYNPIPLTEEWLLKFGFELKEESFQDTLLDTFMFHKDNIVDVEFSDKHKLLYWHDNYTNVYHQEIKQVHQLQNLYFALRGEELTID